MFNKHAIIKRIKPHCIHSVEMHIVDSNITFELFADIFLSFPSPMRANGRRCRQIFIDSEFILSESSLPIFFWIILLTKLHITLYGHIYFSSLLEKKFKCVDFMAHYQIRFHFEMHTRHRNRCASICLWKKAIFVYFTISVCVRYDDFSFFLSLCMHTHRNTKQTSAHTLFTIFVIPNLSFV